MKLLHRTIHRRMVIVKDKKAYITRRSRVVPLHSTNQAQVGLISEF